MPPKQRFTHELILEKAYGMFMEGGMDAVNARSVSKALNCSTQPIFSYFPDMNGLRSALVEKGILEFNTVMDEAALQDSFIITRCVAFIDFAGRQPRVFNHLLTLPDEENNPRSILLNVPENTWNAERESTGLDDEKLGSVFQKLNTYAAGLAFMVASDKNSFPEERIQSELKEVYDALLRAA